jgi:D-glycero-alpha-D-manno-heptose-7-phosphate kinase
MILVKTPFRISFAGGGSDLPSFYRRHYGAVVSTTIDKFMYVAIHPYFHNKIRIKYSQTEDVDTVAQIRHPLVRECLTFQKIEQGMEIASFADVPAGTGMGSSSAFTVCLLHALYALRSQPVTPEQLASEACFIEMERVGERIGKQDQYAAACGGLNYIRFNENGTVAIEQVKCSAQTRADLQRHLMLFYVGGERAASAILSEQSQNMEDRDKYERVTRMVGLASDLRSVLEKGQIALVGEILHEGWKLKSGLAVGTSNPVVDLHYRLAREAGASGGKLLGAGGGGFLLIFCHPDKQLAVRDALGDLREMTFAMTQQGSNVIYDDSLNSSMFARAEAMGRHA